MNKPKILLTSDEFTNEFIRCCKTYTELNIAVAWCGNPNKFIPYQYLEDFKGKINVLLGTSFYHTHPDAFDWFKGIGSSVKVFRDDEALFHPKIYLFSKRNKFALFIGSSNLTYGGFFNNIETNVLIEGIYSKRNGDEISALIKQLDIWHQPEWSFSLSDIWIEEYRKKYKQISKREKKYRIKTASIEEEEIGTASWLKNADWNTYYREMKKRIADNSHDLDGYWIVFEKTKELLTLPWKISYFEDIEKRRIILGINDYASLGHIGASGKFMHLLANGSKEDWNVIVKSINRITKMEAPLNWMELETELNKLVQLGQTMKIWGRLLCIVRPDLYCTVSSDSVRTNLSKTLKISKNYCITPKGYVELIKMIQSSTWFNSEMPKNKNEVKFWKYRVALMDLIFY